METSLRLASDSKALKIHAKEIFPIDSNTRLQVHGVLDSKVGAPNSVSAMIRHFYRDLSASLGVGLKYDRRGDVQYNVRGKKEFSVTSNDHVTFNVKGRCDVDNEFKKWKSTGATELSWIIYDIKKGQDVRLKFGYEIFDKVPYCQIKENNWTFNADANCKWSVRYDL